MIIYWLVIDGDISRRPIGPIHILQYYLQMMVCMDGYFFSSSSSSHAKLQLNR